MSAVSSAGSAGSTSSRRTVLALNSGSSSLKFALYDTASDDLPLLLEGSADGIGHDSGSFTMHSADGTIDLHDDGIFESQTDALQRFADALKEHDWASPAMVGHRLVHGGPHLRRHQLLTDAVREQLEAAVHFAPLHIPPALALIDEATRRFAGARQAVCFDTAFHETLPPQASHLPLPKRYAEAGVIRYGFHGLSYESIVRRLGHPMPARAVFAHLGNGSSVCAVRDGLSVDTSMGMTPTGGVPMGTRSGDLDPGVLLHLMRTERLDADALETLLNHESGLAGYSGGESDMRALVKRAGAGDADAALAINAYTTAVRKTIGGYAALLGGIDLLVFTGGIGEHSLEVRRAVCDGLAFCGIGLDDPAGRVRVLVSEEERQIAMICRGLLNTIA
ncbi:acetate/propionate family kinase [Paraburkholderia phosphatilytica]|uniref:acetate/propionate family kinase n=1 Tax=Paraburkholderia phosphatilytica TaxID=2282883 RepID=UPI000E4C5172|nr:acetate/propionate family kinase [Paraburkholderia phosphatilytica]